MSDNSPVPPPGGGNIIQGLASPGHSAGLDPVWLLLQDKRSPATRRAYKADLHDFFGCPPGQVPPQAEVREFVGQSVPQLAQRLILYREEMRVRGLAPATINRRLAAVRSLLKISYKLGLAQTDGRNLVDGEKSRSYRDTRGTDVDNLKRLLALPDRTSLRGKRDYALLRLLCDNALRRAEICALDVADFVAAERRLAITGKGRGEREWVTLHATSAAATALYLAASGHQDGPLFLTCDHRPRLAGTRLTPGGLYDVVGTYGKRIGLKLSPHKLRHSAITAALNATGGDVRRVQRLSRHVKLETLTIYDDNRADHQGEITTILGDLLDS